MTSSRGSFTVFTVVGVAAFVVIALLVAVFLDSPASVWVLLLMSFGALAWGGVLSAGRGRRSG